MDLSSCATDLLDSISETVKVLFDGRKQGRISDYESDVQYSSVCKDYECALAYCREKREIVENIYGMYRKLVKKLDSELEKFRLELEADNSGITEQIERRIHNVLGRAVTSAAKAERRRQRFRFQQTAHCKSHLSVRRRLIGQAFRNVRKSSCFRSSTNAEPSNESGDPSYVPEGVDYTLSAKHLDSLSPSSLARSQDPGFYQDFYMHSIPPDGTPKFDERDPLRLAQSLSFPNKEPFPDSSDPNTSGLMADSPMQSDEDSEDENFLRYPEDNPSISLKAPSYLSQDLAGDSLGLSTTTSTKGLLNGLTRSSKTTPLTTTAPPYETSTNTILNTVSSLSRPSAGFDARSSSSTHAWSNAQQLGSTTPTTAPATSSGTPHLLFSNPRERRRPNRRPDKSNLCDDLSSAGSHSEDLIKIEDGTTTNTTLLGVLNDCVEPSSSFVSSSSASSSLLAKLDPGDGRHDLGDLHTSGLPTHSSGNNDDEDCKRYCVCHDISYGDMIACDAPDCPYEWFHYACVNLTVAPKGRWFCPNCVKSFANLKHSKKRTTRK